MKGLAHLSPRERAAEQSRACKRRRAALLHEACSAIAERETKGEKRGRAIKEVARKFCGRSLGFGRSLNLSRKSAERIYYTFLKRGDAAFALHYIAGRKQEIDPILLHLVTQAAIRQSKSVSEILTEAGATRRQGPSLSTIYRSLRAKELNRFLHAESRLIAQQKRLGVKLLGLQRELCALRSAAEEKFLAKGGHA